MSRGCPAKCPARDSRGAQRFCGFGAGVPATVPVAVPNILLLSRCCPGGCPGKNGLGYGFGCSWSECFGFKNVWQIDKIRIFTAIGCTDTIEQLLDWAEQFALDRSCRLIPSPALSEADFLIWRNYDPEALLKVLIHPDAAEFVKEAKHGLVYEHPELADAGARNEANIMIPKGKELRKVYAGEVLKAVEALLAHRKGAEQ